MEYAKKPTLEIRASTMTFMFLPLPSENVETARFVREVPLNLEEAFKDIFF